MSNTSVPLAWLPAELARLEQSGLRRQRRQVTPLPGGWCEVDGRRLRNFASNDYLNLAYDERVRAAAKETLEVSVGATASALVCGRTDWHVRLERAIAEFEGTASAVLFPTGFAANVGTLAALIRPEDVVFCDRFNHASLIDGCRQSRAKFRVYRHDELERLDQQLQATPTTTCQWIVTDAVFSMDGDVAPLPELCDIAERSGAAVIVDEAHGTGVFGELGRGVAEFTNTEHRVAVRVGTLSKAIGTLGGFVAGSQSLTDWLWNTARSQVFSTALPPVVCAAATASIEIIRTEPQRRQRLHALCSQLRSELSQRGIEPIANSVGPIIPIVIGDPERTVAVARELERRGFLVAAIRPPTVPPGTSRLRLSLTTAFDASDIVALANALSEVLGAT